MDQDRARGEPWPPLRLEEWSDTCTTLHLWTQIVGKIRLAQSPWMNHCWQVTLYVTGRGLSTSPIPHGTRTFELEFDFPADELVLRTSDGATGRIPLRPQSVAAFYRLVVATLGELGLPVKIQKRPNEVADPVPFDQDDRPRVYDADAARRYWRVLVQADRVFKIFRGRFVGKVSPVHYFWGAPDLAVTRFSGRLAPVHPGGIPNLPDAVTRDAYSHEVSSCGFWPGGGPFPHSAFYSYAYPTPAGFSEALVRPAAALWSADLGEFLLPYDAVRESKVPDATLLDFLQSTYDAAADLAGWDRKALERVGHGPLGV
jgi:Family of unknown function (DUF5996)